MKTLKTTAHVICMIVCTATGAIAGHYEGVATTLKEQITYQTAFMAQLATPPAVNEHRKGR